MDRTQIGKLLGVVSIHYPSFKTNSDPETMIDEWHRIIGFLDYDEAIKRLDAYMEDPANTKPPRAVDFKKVRPSESKNYFSGGIGPYMVSRDGDLVNESGMRFAFPDRPDEKYRYNQRGDICSANDYNRVVITCSELIKRRQMAAQMREQG